MYDVGDIRQIVLADGADVRQAAGWPRRSDGRILVPPG
jgi:hypothetical protein